MKSTDNENEPWNKIGTVGELLDYYLKLLDEKVPKTNDIYELKKFIQRYMIPHLQTESSDSESDTDDEGKLGYWGSERIQEMMKQGPMRNSTFNQKWLRRFIHENWAFITRVVAHVHDRQHRLTAGAALCGAYSGKLGEKPISDNEKR